MWDITLVKLGWYFWSAPMSFPVLRQPSLTTENFQSPLEPTDRIRLLSPAWPCQTPPTLLSVFFSPERDMLLNVIHPPCICLRWMRDSRCQLVQPSLIISQRKFYSAVCGRSVWGCDPAGLSVCWPHCVDWTWTHCYEGRYLTRLY